MIYFNREDPALFVERRDGIGYTPNFAHPPVWLLFGVLAGIVGSAVLIL